MLGNITRWPVAVCHERERRGLAVNSPVLRLPGLPRDGLRLLKPVGSLGDLMKPVGFVELKPLT
ncbi:hypothetical protein [Streptomyces sp. AC550_RSS872]|uniref:hypothetical protein n=1 Tax=Streptomyces sp. AC550_RSS872 TaxID=2823689 RepID=UPI0020B69522|nr:hypothetical protein [Streptomyces sp. AC550_RSS872]